VLKIFILPQIPQTCGFFTSKFCILGPKNSRQKENFPTEPGYKTLTTNRQTQSGSINDSGGRLQSFVFDDIGTFANCRVLARAEEINVRRRRHNDKRLMMTYTLTV